MRQPRKWMALKHKTDVMPFIIIHKRVGGRSHGFQLQAWALMEPWLVQILVKVANIQAKILKAEVEKGSMSPVLGHGLVGPKCSGFTSTDCFNRLKGNSVNIPKLYWMLNLHCNLIAVTKQHIWHWCKPRKELSLLFNNSTSLFDFKCQQPVESSHLEKRLQDWY